MGSARFSVQEAIKRGWLKQDVCATTSLAPARAAPRPGSAAARLAEIEREVSSSHNRKPSRRIDREGNAQTSVIDQFDLEFPALSGRLFHVANGGKRTRTESYYLRRQGVRKGVPDLVLPVPMGSYHGLYVEMKAEKPHSSQVTEDQDDWIGFLNAQGYFATVARGALEAMDIIRRYLKAQDPA